MPKIESEKIDCLHRPCSRPAPRAKSNRYARTQKSSNSLIRFRCSNSCFLLETCIAGQERLLLAKWHPKAEKKNGETAVFDTADMHEKLYGRSRLYASAQRRHQTGGVLSLFSSLSFDISIKNSVQRWSSDFQGLFRVKNRKMARGSNDLSTLPLMILTQFFHVIDASWLAAFSILYALRLPLCFWYMLFVTKESMVKDLVIDHEQVQW